MLPALCFHAGVLQSPEGPCCTGEPRGADPSCTLVLSGRPPPPFSASLPTSAEPPAAAHQGWLLQVAKRIPSKGFNKSWFGINFAVIAEDSKNDQKTTKATSRRKLSRDKITIS